MTSFLETVETAFPGVLPGVIDRPEIGYDDDAHAYTLDGVPVPGVSSIAKIGGDSWGPGSWWGWGIAAEGVAELLADGAGLEADRDAIRRALMDQGWTPNRKRDQAGDRGTNVHDAFERLIQKGVVPKPALYPEAEAGHVLSLLRWFLHYRPSFEAAEVVVGSRRHGFAGRYDLRCLIEAERLGLDPEDFLDGLVLCLVDLKTSKGVYPEVHFPQLSGYELASVEMGFRETDAQFVLRTSADGSFVPWEAVEPKDWARSNFVRSWSTGDDFLAYLEAYRAVQRIEWEDPKRVAKRVAAQARRDLEDALLAAMPGTARELAERAGVPAAEASKRLQGLRKDGRAWCQKPGNVWRAS